MTEVEDIKRVGLIRRFTKPTTRGIEVAEINITPLMHATTHEVLEELLARVDMNNGLDFAQTHDIEKLVDSLLLELYARKATHAYTHLGGEVEL